MISSQKWVRSVTIKTLTKLKTSFKNWDNWADRADWADKAD